MRTSCVKNGLVFGIIFLFIVMSITPSSSTIIEKKPSVPFSKGRILYVGGSVDTQCTKNYSKIQDAIYDANPGDTVFVYDDSSPYYENIWIDKSIKLVGENKDTTVIHSVKQSEKVVFIFSSTDNVIVSGFTITGGDEGIILGGNNNTIKGNKIMFNKCGIEIYPYDDGNNNVITENIIVHNSYVGILEDCRDSYYTVTWNVISGNGKPESDEGGIYKHHSGGIFHHNDFDLNWGYNAYADLSTWAFWDDGSEGNYWDDWESNPGYPDVYIIKGSYERDYHPSATPYFGYPIVRIQKSSYEAHTNETIHFRSYVNKPISSLSILWDFDDGNTSNKTDPDHTYSESDIYHINVTITDDKGVSDTDRSIAYIGFPPDNPVITGPTNGTIGTLYNYSIVANDSDSDYLYYRIEEDYYGSEIGPYPVGVVAEISGVWGDVGNHTFRVKAIDDTLFESGWTYFTTYIPRNRMSVDSLFQLLFDRFPLLEVFLRAMNLLR